MSSKPPPHRGWFRNFHVTEVDPAIYHAIGRLISEWNRIESICFRGVAVLMDADLKQTQIVLAGMQSRTLLTTLRTLVHHVDPGRKAEFDALYAKLERAAKYRNNVAHGRVDGLLDLEPTTLTLRRARVQKLGVSFESKETISAHLIRRRALYVMLVGQALLGFIAASGRPLVSMPQASGRLPPSPAHRRAHPDENSPKGGKPQGRPPSSPRKSRT
jgi:hypothetical protein